MPEASIRPAGTVDGRTPEVRLLTDLSELRGVDALFASVWGPGAPAIGVELLRALSHAGGYVSPGDPAMTATESAVIAGHVDVLHECGRDVAEAVLRLCRGAVDAGATG